MKLDKVGFGSLYAACCAGVIFSGYLADHKNAEIKVMQEPIGTQFAAVSKGDARVKCLGENGSSYREFPQSESHLSGMIEKGCRLKLDVF